MVCNKDCFKLGNGKSADVKYGYNGQEYVIFDLTRDSQERINWEVIEEIKNGSCYSTKYECEIKFYECPKVAVFMNCMPDKTKLSVDR